MEDKYVKGSRDTWYILDDYVDGDTRFKTELVFDETDGWILRKGRCGLGEADFWVWTEDTISAEEAYKEVFGES